MDTKRALICFILFILGCSGPSIFSEVSGVHSKEIHTVEALQKYYRENRELPFDAGRPMPWIMEIPHDFPVLITGGDGKSTDWFQGHKHRFHYVAIESEWGIVLSPGPDRKFQVTEDILREFIAQKKLSSPIEASLTKLLYDSTNGTISAGDIFHEVRLEQ